MWMYTFQSQTIIVMNNNKKLLLLGGLDIIINNIEFEMDTVILK